MYNTYDDVITFQPLSDEELEFLNRRIEEGKIHFKILEVKKGITQKEPPRPWLMVKFNAADRHGVSEIGTAFLWIDGKTQRELKEFLASINKEKAFSEGTFKLSELTDLEGEAEAFLKDEEGKDGRIYKKLKIKKWLPKINKSEEPNDDTPW